jgi:hypothetical protein
MVSGDLAALQDATHEIELRAVPLLVEAILFGASQSLRYERRLQWVSRCILAAVCTLNLSSGVSLTRHCLIALRLCRRKETRCLHMGQRIYAFHHIVHVHFLCHFPPCRFPLLP